MNDQAIYQQILNAADGVIVEGRSASVRYEMT